ncbi:MAG: BtpA/SgcQ family protein [Anaerolineaceae bacterium]|nr:BtpA/SgcQ family protein [Anaerolineaceae bacterium]
MEFNKLFKKNKPIIGMVHLRSLPGSPRFDGDIDGIYEQAEWEAQTLAEAGVDGFIVENQNDEPYQIGEPVPEQFAIMAAIVGRLRKQVEIPIGVNVQFNAWQAEIAMAYACKADFMRVEVFVDTVLMAQGTVQPCAAGLTRLRKALGAENVMLWTDIQTKYTQNILPQPLTQSAQDAEASGSDCLIVTGAATGMATPLDAVGEVKAVSQLPVVVGSGTNFDNVLDVLKVADGVIIGSALKEGGNASNKVSAQAAKAFMDKVDRYRSK